MASYGVRVLKGAIPAALVLALAGYCYAQMAGTWYASNSNSRMNPTEASANATELTNQLKIRIPVTMALWGIGFVAAYEGIRGLWKKPVKTNAATQQPPMPTTEQQLQALLETIDAEPPMLAETPPPVSVDLHNKQHV